MLEFSAILYAVTPRARTNQYFVLAALYYLGAHRTAVTAREVNELLKRHLRKKAPENVNDSLRKYPSLVEVAASDERPLRWKLTRKGLDELRKQSGLALATASTAADFSTDIAFICALQHPEFASLIQALGGEEMWKDAGSTNFCHLYRTCELTTVSNNQLKVVGTVATSMGLTAAAIATTQIIHHFRPRLVVMVGIAAGTRSGGKQFGDVLVADPSIDYNSGKVVQDTGIREFLPDPYPIGLNPRLRSILLQQRTTDRLFEDIRQRWKGPLPETANRMHLGPLGAADQVIDDPSRIIEIQRNWRKLIGVEMETYGVYRACHEAPDPKPRYVSFKSVCDFAAEKTDSWQEFASFVAAEFAVGFLKAEWERIWPASV